MERISVATVQEAYRQTGLIPTRRLTYGNGFACPIAAVAAARSFTERGEPWDFGHLVSYLGLSSSYTLGFMHSFDEIERLERPAYPQYLVGYEDGQAAAAALFPTAAS